MPTPFEALQISDSTQKRRRFTVRTEHIFDAFVFNTVHSQN